MTRRVFSKSLLALSLGLTLVGSAVAQSYPSRPITMVVPWGAGGGTDATARIVAALMEKEMGQPVNVVNRTGGNGVVGHSAIATAPPDGYTIGMITVEISMMHWAGLTELNPKDYTPLSLMNIDPAAVTVRADSPYKTVNDLLNAVKANPGKFKASGTGQGGIWHLALAGMLKDQKLDVSATPWVPSNGAAPAMNDLAAGGVEFVTCSLPESRALIDAGKARPLAVMASQPSGLYPNVPTLKAATGSNWTIGAWRGIAGPKGLPADVQAKLGTVLKKIYDSQDYQGFMQQRGFGVVYADSKGFEQFMAKGDADMGVVMKSLGLAK
ncbi:MAG: tripartite tricarboxylate transporter substrate binding protein [Betaproteobacteria bacterium]|nr:tripartite tricarboxylate transporter substrate binding protein [Betaproteobacteria bacterium]